jgi:outer membrane protein TolC
MYKWILILAGGLPLAAQEALSLRQAIELALQSHPLAAAAAAGEREAEARVRQARSAYLPRLSFSESFQRSNNPVFVFSSLLTQHQFTAANFDLEPLNRPDALNNAQARLSVEQVLWDSKQTSRGVEAARLARQMAGEDTRSSRSGIILGVVRAYYAVGLARQNLEVAEQSVKSAAADLDRAQAIFESGRSTEADVLAIRVHLAAMREQQIRGRNKLEIAQAALNDALGTPLDSQYDLTTSLEAAPAGSTKDFDEYRRLAAEQRPERRQAELAATLAQTQQKLAEAAYWPQVVFQGIVESDRQRYFNRGGANWFTAVSLRWSLFNGGETKARADQSRFAEVRAEALLRRADSAIQLEVRKAYLDVKSAAQRLEVATAAVAEAEEGHRIIRNRHEAGLTTVTELLRSDAALAAARTRRLAAVYDLRVAAAALEHAAGNLTADTAVGN